MSDTSENYQFKQSSIWVVIPNYDLSSRQQVCSITFTGKRPEDVGVFRPLPEGSWIDEEGSYDISQLAVEEAAALLGWHSPQEFADQLADLRERVAQQGIRIANDAKKIKRLEAQVEELAE